MSRIRLMRWAIGFAVSVGFLLLAMFLLWPVTTDSRDPARAAECRNNLKEITLALHYYHDKYSAFPPVFVSDAEGRPMHSWRVLLLPYLLYSRRDDLYQRYRFDEPWDGPNNSLLHGEQVAAYACPSDGGAYQSRWTSYLAVSGPATMWRHDATIGFRVVKDRVEDTLAFVEVANSGIHWLQPRDIPLSSLDEPGAKWPPVGSRAEHRVQQFWGYSDWHEYAMTVGFQVLRIERSATAKDLRPLCTINGHEDCAPVFRQHARPWK